MRVGVIQSSYLPWRGYFDFVDDVDLFVLYDDVQYSHGSWRNRNRILTPGGLKWISVPVHRGRLQQRVCDTEIAESVPWRRAHENMIRANYGGAPYLQDALEILVSALARHDRMISELNRRLIEAVMAYLGITTPLRDSREFAVQGRGTDRLVALLQAVGATIYLSGPSARQYLDGTAFRRAGIVLEYKSYDYAPYPQLRPGFEGAVTVLDLIANCGPGSRALFKSLRPNAPAEGS